MSKQLRQSGLLAVLALCLVALVVLAPRAAANEYQEQSPGWSDPLRVDGSLAVPSGDPGQTVNVIIPVIFSPEFGWSSVRDISITPVMSMNPELWPFIINRPPPIRNH